MSERGVPPSGRGAGTLVRTGCRGAGRPQLQGTAQHLALPLGPAAGGARPRHHSCQQAAPRAGAHGWVPGVGARRGPGLQRAPAARGARGRLWQRAHHSAPLPARCCLAVVGRRFHTKVNANIGNSAVASSIEEVGGRGACCRPGRACYRRPPPPLRDSVPAWHAGAPPPACLAPRGTPEGASLWSAPRPPAGAAAGAQEVEKLQWATIWGADTVMDLR